MDACPRLPLGVCFDTAHAFTAGYDIREEDGLAALIQKMQRTVGLKNVRAIHFNDSRAVYNSRVDRHWHIGEGHIGMEALRRVAQHPKLRHCAFILETPYDDPRADLQNLEMLRSFVSEFEGADQTKLSGQERDPVPRQTSTTLTPDQSLTSHYVMQPFSSDYFGPL